MSTISLTINDKPVKVEKGASILEAAREAGIDIPTLCSHEKLLPQGGCRLCTVELLEGKRTRLVASCAYIAEEGMKVRTESDQLSKGRKMIIELLMARAPGVQELQEYAIRYGAERDRFETEPTYCILCGLCVRYCAEVKKKNAIGFIGRGSQREIMFIPEIAAKECPSCGECWKICPTGVLPSNYGLARVPHFIWPDDPFFERAAGK